MEPQTSELRGRLEREVVKLRRSGVIPPSLEAKMTQAVNELKPRLRFDSTKDRLFNVEATSYIDTAVPTDSKRPGVTYVKRAIKAGVGWYLTYVTQQVNNFTFETVGLLNALELRLSEQELRLAKIAPQVSLGHTSGQFPANILAEQAVRAQLLDRQNEQPILVTDAGGDRLLAELTALLPDLVYGQIEDSDLADRSAKEGLDVRNSSLLWHLEHCADGALGALVLRGTELECSPVWFKRGVLAETRRVLAADGVAVLIHHEPSALALSPELSATAAIRGEPISVAAWAILADEAGFSSSTETIDVDTAVTRLQR
ncbi:hypothetical protein [Ferrimicrobium acidiphilum]|uniref:hypothetical protein n=1 Tax=Ferrimicrobium acidiphilum TaxID=121039 RepID=UPI0023F1E79C|nr:hypothetical protein [Ferrimicrobium acidiphilum]